MKTRTLHVDAIKIRFPSVSGGNFCKFHRYIKTVVDNGSLALFKCA